MFPTISSTVIFLTSLLLPQLSYSISTPTRAAPPTFSLAVKYTNGTYPEIPLYLSATGFATRDPSAAAQLYLSSDGGLYEYGVVANTYRTCSPASSGPFKPLTTNCTDPITTTFSGVFYGPLLWMSPRFHTPGNQAAFFLTEGGTVMFDGGVEGSGEQIYLVYDYCSERDAEHTTAPSPTPSSPSGIAPEPATFSLAIKYPNSTCPSTQLYLSPTGAVTTESSSAAVLWITPGGVLVPNVAAPPSPYGACAPPYTGVFAPLSINCSAMGPVIETFSGVFDGPLTWTNAVFSRPGGEAVFFLEGENVVFDGGYNGGGGDRVLLVHNYCSERDAEATTAGSSNMKGLGNGTVVSPSIPLWTSGAPIGTRLISCEWVVMAVMVVVGGWMV